MVKEGFQENSIRVCHYMTFLQRCKNNFIISVQTLPHAMYQKCITFLNE